MKRPQIELLHWRSTFKKDRACGRELLLTDRYRSSQYSSYHTQHNKDRSEQRNSRPDKMKQDTPTHTKFTCTHTKHLFVHVEARKGHASNQTRWHSFHTVSLYTPTLTLPHTRTHTEALAKAYLSFGRLHGWLHTHVQVVWLRVLETIEVGVA